MQVRVVQIHMHLLLGRKALILGCDSRFFLVGEFMERSAQIAQARADHGRSLKFLERELPHERSGRFLLEDLGRLQEGLNARLSQEGGRQQSGQHADCKNSAPGSPATAAAPRRHPREDAAADQNEHAAPGAQDGGEMEREDQSPCAACAGVKRIF